jgi:phytoene dehydrogenase-like protein
MSKSIIIIGGGIAGLSAGIYARMNGFTADVYEMNSIAGGLCTAWRRKDFTFDGCVHWLTGTSPSSHYYKLWEEIGAIQGKTFHHYDYYSQSMDEKGNRFTAYCDPERLRKEMLSIAPEDKGAIDQVISDIKKFMRYGLPLEVNISNLYPTIRSLALLYKYRHPVKQLAEKFKNPVLRNLFILALDWGPMCSSFLLWTLSLMATGNGGYPMGGSLPLIESVENRFIQLGGAIHYHKKVTKILVDNDTATGIILSDGTEVRSDIVISAADGYSTIFNWLEGKYVDKKLQRIYQSFILFPPLVFVSLGINGTYLDKPHSMTYSLKKPFHIGEEEIPYLYFKNYSFDPSFAPHGKCVFTVMISANYDYWKKLKEHKDEYDTEKARIGEAVVQGLGELYPDLPSKVEVMDVASPMTFQRYTGNHRGSYEGWMFDKKALTTRIPQTLPGLKNFFMAGHWVSPGGGLPSGVITSRNAMKIICKQEGKRFTTDYTDLNGSGTD